MQIERMRLQLQKELSTSLAGRVYNIIHPEIKRKANRYLQEILSNIPDENTNEEVKTVKDYYEHHLKTPLSNSKLHRMQKKNCEKQVNSISS